MRASPVGRAQRSDRSDRAGADDGSTDRAARPAAERHRPPRPDRFRRAWILGPSPRSCNRRDQPRWHPEYADHQKRRMNEPSQADVLLLHLPARSLAVSGSASTRDCTPSHLTCHVIRSRRQYPATTCNLSRAEPHLRVRVQGCSWSSVAVDVAIDVDQSALWSRALTGGLPARRAPDSGSGASESVYLTQVPHRGGGITTILHAGARVASRRSGTARPRGSPGAALNRTGACVVWLCPRAAVW